MKCLVLSDTPERYRERRERIPSRFELFFDLVFVAIAHQLSDTAAERADAAGFVHFVLVSTFSGLGSLKAP